MTFRAPVRDQARERPERERRQHLGRVGQGQDVLDAVVGDPHGRESGSRLKVHRVPDDTSVSGVAAARPPHGDRGNA